MRKHFILEKPFFDQKILSAATMTDHIPQVSVGLPVYNGERFIRETIESILRQTYTDFELIISDNASTDGTRDICQEYAVHDGRIHYVRSDVNRGASWNYRNAFELARGKYFRWSPSDDLFAKDSLEQCVATLDAHPDAVLCYPKTVLIDEHGRAIRTHEENLDLRSSDVGERFYQALDRAGQGNVIYGLLRSEKLRQTGLMGKYPGADVVLIQELTLYGTFIEIPTTYFYRRKHERAFSSIKAIDAQQEFFDPATKGRLFMYLWKHYSQHLVSIQRSPLAIREKMRLVYLLGRSAVSIRHHLLRELRDGVRHLIRKS